MKRFTLITVVFVGLMTSNAMAAHDLQTTLSVSPTTAGSVAATNGSSKYGNNVPASATTHLPAGHLVNEEGATDAPLEGEKVGNATINARNAQSPMTTRLK